jgi:hypothetical protein
MNIFNVGQTKGVKTNKFDLSHEKKLSMDFGDLVPVALQEVIPGDSFRMSSEIFIRFSPLLSPVMHMIDVFTHSFYVPSRIVFKGFENFITGGDDGLDTTVHPYLAVTDNQDEFFQIGGLADAFGIPTLPEGQSVDSLHINALPFRAYQMIYNEYYRDQDLIEKIDFSVEPGEVNNTTELESLLTLRKRAWQKDYFTSARPSAQKGGQVNIPIADWEPEYEQQGTVTGAGASGAQNVSSNDDDLLVGGQAGNIQNLTSPQDINAGNITDLRTAFRLQEWLEKAARAGSRYIEVLKSFFGVKSSDGRLQRPEYLGGGRQNVVVSEVLNHTGTAEAPQGAMAGHAMAAGSTIGFQRRFEEHGYIITIMSIMPKPSYQDGIHRLWFKSDRFDYPWPQFAHIGEQPVLNRELFFDYWSGTDANENTFGYAPRYSEYKYNASTVHGEFRDTLNFWHMSRYFASLPALNQEFIEVDKNSMNRIFAVTGGEYNKIYCQIYHHISALRKLPVFGIPQI